MTRMVVTGLGFWSTGYPNLAAWKADTRDPEHVQPPCTVAPPRLLRGTSVLTRMFVETATQAGQQATLDLTKVATVFASAFGEVQIALAQFEMMRTGDGIVSPARFKNSVHNTGAGVFSIAAKNRGFTTALAGGWETTAVALLEAQALLATGHDEVLVSVADEPIPPNFLVENRGFEGVGVSLALTKDAPAERTLAVLEDLRLAEGPAGSPLPDGIAGNPVAPAVSLALAIDGHMKGDLSLTHRGEVSWSVKLK